MSNKLRSHGKSMVVWVLLAMLVLGLGGFGMSNFSGRLSAIGSVGETEVSVNDYARALRDALTSTGQQMGRPLTMAEASQFGLDREVQGQLFGQAAVAEAARVLGLSVGDVELNRQITAAQAFQGLDGKFDRETYRSMLRQQGYTESQFEADLRSDIARALLTEGVSGGTVAPAGTAAALAAFLTEERAISFVEITEAGLAAPIAAPDEATLEAWYKDHPEEFTSPEIRKFSYVWLTPEMLMDKVTLDDDTLRAAYEERRDEFQQPEKRSVDRLVYPTAEEAAAARAKLDAGASFGDLATERGLSLSDTDLGEVTEAELGAAGAAVFALSEPGVVGPVETDLGPALFAMNGISPAQNTSFEEAKADLGAEAKAERARRMIGEMTTDLEDRLAGGATLEQLAEETDMELGTIDMAPGTDDGIAGYEAFRAAAEKATPEDFPELGNLDDGGVFALRLDGTVAPALIPFDQAREAVAESWRKAELATRTKARAEELKAAIDAGQPLAAAGMIVETTAKLRRTGFIEGVPAALIDAAFDTEPGKGAVVAAEGRSFVVQVDAVTPADPASEEVAALKASIADQLAKSLTGDMLDLYARAAQAEAGITLDSAAINAVQSQMQ